MVVSTTSQRRHSWRYILNFQISEVRIHFRVERIPARTGEPVFVPLASYDYSQKQLQSLSIYDNPYIPSFLRDISPVSEIILDLLNSHEDNLSNKLDMYEEIPAV